MNCALSPQHRSSIYTKAIKSLNGLFCLPGNNLVKIHNVAGPCLRGARERNWLGVQKIRCSQNTNFPNVRRIHLSVILWQLLTGRLLQQIPPVPGAHLKTKFTDCSFQKVLKFTFNMICTSFRCSAKWLEKHGFHRVAPPAASSTCLAPYTVTAVVVIIFPMLQSTSLGLGCNCPLQC